MPAASGAYGAELSTIQVASQHVQDVAAQLTAQLNRLYTQIEPVASQWQGDAANSFQALHQRWNDDATKINQVLGQISEGLLVNFHGYRTAEDTNAQSMTTTAAAL